MKKHELEHELNVYKKALDLMTNFYCDLSGKCYMTEQCEGEFSDTLSKRCKRLKIEKALKLAREVVDKNDN